MAKRKKVRDESVYDFDHDLGLDAIDELLRPQVDERAVKSGKREAVTRAIKGAIAGAKSNLYSENTLERFVKGALPREYTMVYNDTRPVREEIVKTYEEAVKTVRPLAGRIASRLDRLSTNEQSLYKKISGQLKRIFGISDVSTSTYSSEEATIQSGLSSVFDQQLKLQAYQDAKDQLKDETQKAIDSKRFQSQQEILASIDHNIATIAGYETNITQAYQRKSLELQYRQYFVMAQLLQRSSTFFEASRIQNEALIKNTALPDYAKLQNYERFKDIARTKFMGSFQDALFGPDTILGKGLESLRKGIISTLRSVTNYAVMGFDQYSMAKDTLGSAQELGAMGGDTEEFSPSYLGGKFLGEELTRKPIEKAAYFTGRRLRSFIAKPGSRIDELGKRLAEKTADIPGSIQELYYSDRFQNPQSIWSDLFSRSFLEPFVNRSADLNLKGSVKTSQLVTTPAVFDHRVYRSITDVIPGYLAKILLETTKISRSVAANTSLTDEHLEVYDFDRSRFITKKDFKPQLHKRITEGWMSDEFKSRLQDFVTEFGLDQALTPEELDLFNEAMLTWMMRGNSLTHALLTNPAFLRLIPKAQRKGIEEKLRTLKDSHDATTKRRFNETTKRLMGTIPDYRAKIEAYERAGFAPILEELGIIEPTATGARINAKWYRDAARGKVSLQTQAQAQEGVPTSESTTPSVSASFTSSEKPFVAEHTQSDALRTLVTKLDERFSKPLATYDSVTHDLLRRIEENTRAAIETLTQSEAKREEETRTWQTLYTETTNRFNKIFTALKEKTRARAKAGVDESIPDEPHLDDTTTQRAGDKKTVGGYVDWTLGVLKEGLEEGAGYAYEGAKKGVRGARRFGKATREKTHAFYQTHKDTLRKGLERFLTASWGLAADALSATKTFITDFIPQQVKRARALLARGKKALENLNDPAIDIYVAGETTPRLLARLMRAGAYLDQATGNPIYHPSEIRGNVVTADGDVVLSAEDIAKGLVDKEGKPLATLTEKILSHIVRNVRQGVGRAVRFYRGAATLVREGIHKGIDKFLGGSGRKLFPHGLPSEGFSPEQGDKIYQVLVDIREILAHCCKVKLDDQSWINRLRRDKTKTTTDTQAQKEPETATDAQRTGAGSFAVVGGLLSGVKRLFSRSKEQEGGATKEKATYRSVKDKARGYVETIKDKARGYRARFKDRIGGLTEFNDINQDGIREGSWYERLQQETEREAERAKEQKERVKATLRAADPRYYTGNAIDKVLGALGTITDVLKRGFSFLGDVIQSVIGGKLLSKLFGRGAAAKTATTAAGGAAKAGLLRRSASALWQGTKAAAGTAFKASRFALGGLGTLGSSALGLVGITATGALATLTGAAIVAGVAYGGYKGYKYLTRNAASKRTQIRLAHYGIPPKDKDYYHYLLKLEAYVEDKIAVIKGNEVYVDFRKFDGKTVLEIFDLTEADEEEIEVLREWLLTRFIPAFIDHRRALLRANRKLELSEIDKLKGEELRVYLDSLKLSDETFSYTQSPIKAYRQFNATKDDVLALIEEVRKEAFGTTLTDTKTSLKSAAVTLSALKQKAKTEEELDSLQQESLKAAKDKRYEGVAGSIRQLNDAAGSVVKIPLSLAKLAGKSVATVTGLSYAWHALTDIKTIELDHWRIVHYGLLPLKEYHEDIQRLLKLERYLQKNALQFIKGVYQVNLDKVNMQEVYELFDIDPDSSTGQKRARRLIEYLTARFIPVYLKHINALYQINPNYQLSQLINLKALNYRKYLELTQPSKEIFEVMRSPFIGYDTLPASLEDSKKLYEKLLAQAPKATYPTTSASIEASEAQRRAAVEKEEEVRARAKDRQSEQDIAKVDLSAIRKDVQKSATVEVPRELSAYIEKASERSSEVDTRLRDGSVGLQYIKKASSKVSFEGLNPTLWSRFLAMAQEYGELTGKPIQVNSAYRSAQEQLEAYMRDPKKAAPPGRSMHEYGLALDIRSEDARALESLGLMKKYGFTRPIGKEHWHIEPSGIQLDLTKSKDNPQLATQLILASAFRGGGGYATVPNAIPYRRNFEVAKTVFYSGGIPTDLTSPKASADDSSVSTELSAVENTQGEILPYPDKFAQVEKDPRSVLEEARVAQEHASIAQASAYDSSNTMAGFMQQKPLGALKEVPRASAANAPRFGVMKEVPLEKALGTTPKGLGALQAQYQAGSSQSVLSTTSAGPITDEAISSVLPSLKNIDYKKPDGVKRMIDEVARVTGVDAGTMHAFAAIESSYNPNARARTSSAGGLYQFTDGTWRMMLSKYGSKYGLDASTSKFDPVANSLMAAEYIKENARALSSVVPNPGTRELYLAHFLGAGGARKLLSADPNAPAASILPQAAQANKSIFYTNGRARTVSELIALIDQKVRAKTPQAIDASAPAANEQFKQGASIADRATSTKGYGSSTHIASADVSVAPVGVSTPKPMTTNTLASYVSAPTPVAAPTASTVNQAPAYMATEPVKPPPAPQESTPASVTVDTKGIETLLTQSVDIQKQMAQLLQLIAQNSEPEKLTQAIAQLKASLTPSQGTQEGNTKASKTPPQPRTMHDLPVSLDRRIA
jgi:uncharacterized protein YcbK (DUF882 family)